MPGDGDQPLAEDLDSTTEKLTSRSSHKNLWSYLPKINFDTLLEMGRRQRLVTTTNTMSSSSTSSSAGTSSRSSAGGDSSRGSSASSFSEMRRKLGTHRKSIKNRMKRMYNRSQLVNHYPSPASPIPGDIVTLANNINPSSSPSPSPPPLPNVNLPKRDRNIFTSLSRLRKARTPINCFDEVPKQKRLFLRTNNGKLPEEEATVCHSTFYGDDDGGVDKEDNK